ncbi:MAG: M14 family metallopeptidase [Candidatus Hodarchaeota archaeon]
MKFAIFFSLVIVGVSLFLFGPLVTMLIEYDHEEPEYTPPPPPVGWKSMEGYSNYHDYYETIDYISNITTTFPHITYINASIGQSVEGRDIFALKISDNPSQDENETEILFFAQIHAREAITLENILALITYICDGYGTNSIINNLVNNREIWVIPILNPDGDLYAAYNDSSWRKNRRNNGDGTFGVDLNRNFDYEFDGSGSPALTFTWEYRGPGPFSEPETQALRDFVLDHNFSAAMSMHSYTGCWLWPWSYTKDPSPDAGIYKIIAQLMSIRQPHYPYDTTANDYFYLAWGTATDWLYGEQEVFAYTVEIYRPRRELGNDFRSFNPPNYNIQYECENNIHAFLFFIDIANDPYKVLNS